MPSLKKTAVYAILIIILTTAYIQQNVAEGKEEVIPVSNVMPSSNVNDETIMKAPIGKIGDSMPISRALVAKMTALHFFTDAEIKKISSESTVHFSDVSKDIWYYDYVIVNKEKSIMVGDADSFRPDEPLTLLEAQAVLNRLGNTSIKLKLDSENIKKPISYALWINLYNDVIKENNSNVISSNLFVIGSPNKNPELSSWQMATDKGIFSFKGFNIDLYLNSNINVLLQNKEIVALVGVDNYSGTLKNVFIKDIDENNVTLFADGITTVYPTASINGHKGNIADITIADGKATIKMHNTKTIKGTLEKYEGNVIHLKNDGTYNVSNGAVIYETFRDNIWVRAKNHLIIGAEIELIVNENNDVIAVIFEQKAEMKDIRVVLNTTDFKGLIHDEIVLTSNKDFKITIGDKEQSFKANEKLTINSSVNLSNDEKINVIADKTAYIKILSIKRNWANDESPHYRGTMEISKRNGGFIIVNNVTLEEYLYSVIPSEMPQSHGLEALKTQAVTARSYAYNQILSNRFLEYGANVDDSVNSQVYNNLPATELSVKAANETQGLFLTYNDEVISANFFSTSAGVLANAGEVWANLATNEFPAETKPYLSYKKEYTGKDYGDLSVEENMAGFIKDTELASNDAPFSWFRWNTTMSAKQLSAVINANIKKVYDRSPSMILTKQPDGNFKSTPIETIGNIKDISVIKRGKAGNIMELLLEGDKSSCIIKSEYNIRMLLSPKNLVNEEKSVIIKRKDNSSISDYNMMPSAFFVIDKTIENGALRNVTFYGGGLGHGVGMSQNGVKTLAEKGYKFEDILKFYYEGTEVTKIY